MDTSETYIKQCEKAEKIQDIYYSKNWEREDFSAEKITEIFCPKCNNSLSNYERGNHCSECGTETIKKYSYGQVTKRYTDKKDIWLPRQDQLQEMVNPEVIYGNNALNLHLSLHKFLDDCLKFKIEVGHSMEQLWLAFVMKERYSKIWNGKDWVKLGHEQKTGE